MKSLVIVAVVAVVIFGIGAWWLMSETMSDQGVWIAFAFGEPQDGKMEMQVVVDMGMTMKAPPKTNMRGDILWDEWVTEHFTLEDSSGADLSCKRLAHSLLITNKQAKSNPECFLCYMLVPGDDYTLEYKPFRDESNLYRHGFTAPAGAEEMARVQVPPVED